MKAIYAPRGRAGEYGELACNLYTGCSHGCLYCYVPRVIRCPRDEFRDRVHPRKGILEQLERDAAVLARSRPYPEPDDPARVFLCFTCDPYQPAEAEHRLTRRAIEILNAHGIPARILTKNPALAERDFDLLAAAPARAGSEGGAGEDSVRAERPCRGHNELGVTLVFSREAQREVFEPHAPCIASRINALRRAHAAGVRTWVSLEPVIYPAQALELVSELHATVDTWKVGKLNHDKPREAALNRNDGWRRFLADILGVLERYGASYYIKEDLWAFADDEIKGRFPRTNVEAE